jgi:capsular polysaccharide biosynthesis protein
MNQRAFLQILRRKWWIVVPVFIVTVAATAVMSSSQPAMYESATTLLARPSTVFTDIKSQVSALDTLANRAEIVATYAEVANSRLIKGQAVTDLNLSGEQGAGLSVFAQWLAGTNLIEIVVQGSEPGIVKDFTNKIGEKTVAYVKGLSEVYELTPLDEAAEARLSSTSRRTLDLILGAIFGLVLGSGLAILVEYLQTSRDDRVSKAEQRPSYSS